MIEALGVPHTEVDIILVNDSPVDFGYLVQDGDSIAFTPFPPRSTYLLPYGVGGANPRAA
jgi:hypothetical protein